MKHWALRHIHALFWVGWFLAVGAGTAFAHYAVLNGIQSLTFTGGTTITLMKVYTPSLTPGGLAAAIGVTEQTFTVTGLTTADKVIVNGPTQTALCPMVDARVSGADTLAISFVDLTVALCTPAAGTYTVVAIRS